MASEEFHTDPQDHVVSGDAFEMNRLYLILGGHIFFQTLRAAVELDLFTYIKKNGPCTHLELAAACAIEMKPMRILLLGLTSLGLLVKKNERYDNSREANMFLVTDEPENFVNIIRWQHSINFPSIFHFLDALRSNDNAGLQVFPGTQPTLYERLSLNPDLEKIFQDAMQSISMMANRLLAENIDLSSSKHLLDVGGGDGTNARILASKFPELEVTVMDSKTVCERADESNKNSPHYGRLHTYVGNCFDDQFPDNVDAILFCHFLTIWSEEKNKKLIEKAYRALPEGGRIIIFNMMQHDDGTGPLTAALGSPYFLTIATGEGMLYTWSEYKSWMKSVGFRDIVGTPLPRDHGVIIGIK
jgi:ubiquinone/menaquinone biosynthesis C-methylase UbiE